MTTRTDAPLPRVAYTPTEVGPALGLSAKRVRDLITGGHLRAIPRGQRYVVPIGALAEYLGMDADELRAHLAAAK